MITKQCIERFFSLVDSNGLFDQVCSSDQMSCLGEGSKALITNTETSGWFSQLEEDSKMLPFYEKNSAFFRYFSQRLKLPHWLLIYQENSSTVHFFDSFGRIPGEFNEYIANFCSKYKIIYMNRIPFQASWTVVCGYYCLFVLCAFAQGWKEEEIVMKLRKQVNPDEYVERVIKEIAYKAEEKSFASESCQKFFLEAQQSLISLFIASLESFRSMSTFLWEHIFFCLLILFAVMYIYGSFDPYFIRKYNPYKHFKKEREDENKLCKRKHLVYLKRLVHHRQRVTPIGLTSRRQSINQKRLVKPSSAVVDLFRHKQILPAKRRLEIPIRIFVNPFKNQSREIYVGYKLL